MWMFAYIEQSAIAQQINWNTPFYQPPQTVPGTMNGLLGFRLRDY